MLCETQQRSAATTTLLGREATYTAILNLKPLRGTLNIKQFKYLYIYLFHGPTACWVTDITYIEPIIFEPD